MKSTLEAALGILAAVSLAAPLAAQPNVVDPQAMFSYEQNLGHQVSLDLTFTDDTGKEVTLGACFGQRPVVLALVQYRCPQLCNEVLNGLTTCLASVPGRMGEDYEVVVVSFDHREKAMLPLLAAKKASYLDAFVRDYQAAQTRVPGGKPLTEAGEEELRSRLARSWHFLVGDIPEIEKLTTTVGFRFAYNPQGDRYAHPSGVVVLTPAGVVSQYFYGIAYKPEEMQPALTTAGHQAVGRRLRGFEQVFLLCYDFDAESGGLKANVMKIVRTAGTVTVVALVAFLFFGGWLRPRRARLALPAQDAAAGFVPTPPAPAAGVTPSGGIES